jgi:hypothetical protein
MDGGGAASSTVDELGDVAGAGCSLEEEDAAKEAVSTDDDWSC